MTKKEIIKLCTECHHFKNNICDEWYEDCKLREVMTDRIMKSGAELIAAERQRQIEKEGYTAEHDDAHDVSEFISAAGSYVQSASMFALQDEGAINDALNNGIPYYRKTFIWGPDAFKPTGCLRDLVKAGALIAAAIDRLQRKNEV